MAWESRARSDAMLFYVLRYASSTRSRRARSTTARGAPCFAVRCTPVARRSAEIVPVRSTGSMSSVIVFAYSMTSANRPSSHSWSSSRVIVILHHEQSSHVHSVPSTGFEPARPLRGTATSTPCVYQKLHHDGAQHFVRAAGIEPAKTGTQSPCTTTVRRPDDLGGRGEDRTHYARRFKPSLYRLSYPTICVPTGSRTPVTEVRIRRPWPSRRWELVTLLSCYRCTSAPCEARTRIAGLKIQSPHRLAEGRAWSRCRESNPGLSFTKRVLDHLSYIGALRERVRSQSRRGDSNSTAPSYKSGPASICIVGRRADGATIGVQSVSSPTNAHSRVRCDRLRERGSSPSRIRTCDRMVNSHLPFRLAIGE